jgi:peptide/nickel transport system permease protein
MASDVATSTALDTYLPPQHGLPYRLLRNTVRFCRQKPLGAFGAFVLIVLLVTAIIPQVIAPRAYDAIDIPASLQGPSAHHIFGTDNQGRDVFSRVVYGARTSVIISFGVVAISSIVTTVLGLISGYYGGKIDIVLQRFIDIWQAFPSLIFLIFLVSIFSPGIPTLIVALGIVFSASGTRVIRSAVIDVRDRTYIEAARSTGASDLRIMFTHILPNIVPIILISASVSIGFVILAESSLSFLGLGVPPPHPSWGRMLQDAQQDMQQHPYLALFPGGAIALTVYAFNMLGDALRDVLDPRMRGSH